MVKNFDVQQKNRHKKIRITFEVLILLLLAFVLLRYTVIPPVYKPAIAENQKTTEETDNKSNTTITGDASNTVTMDNKVSTINLSGADKTGFIAVSYLGIDNKDNPSTSLVFKKDFIKHLSALKDSGFVTITQQDIINYYNQAEPLPKNALFLMFEDGRKDTPFLSQGILEKLNYKATIFNYASMLENTDPIFLSASDLKDLEKNTFWEIGSNGYRLSYINVFDRYGNYFGDLNINEFLKIAPYLDRRYNHYLMDYRRDQDEVPLEITSQMAQRIENDYVLMDNSYSDYVGFVPKAYALMHSNSGQFGTHDAASIENERWIKDIYEINFNRDGYAYNDRSVSIYDLSRMQAQGGWSTNHLLMRLFAETGIDMAFVRGNAKRYNQFEILEGAAEFDGIKITLTSVPEKRGYMRLKTKLPASIEVSANLLGNAYGNQGVYLRVNEERKEYIHVSLEDNVIKVIESIRGITSEIYTFDLRSFDNPLRISKSEDELKGLITLQDAIIAYDTNAERINLAHNRKKELLLEQPLTIEQGGEPYIPAIDLRQRGDRSLRIILNGNIMDVYIDNKLVVQNLNISVSGGGYMYFECRSILPEKNLRNIYDPVYDGVFEDVVIKTFGDQKEEVFFSNTLTQTDRFLQDVNKVWENTLNWFISNL